VLDPGEQAASALTATAPISATMVRLDMFIFPPFEHLIPELFVGVKADAVKRNSFL
tara:strand:- start:349 stop:516 length:168 start_codon:yes stop_codon:yes gene_type:complete